MFPTSPNSFQYYDYDYPLSFFRAPPPHSPLEDAPLPDLDQDNQNQNPQLAPAATGMSMSSMNKANIDSQNCESISEDPFEQDGLGAPLAAGDEESNIDSQDYESSSEDPFEQEELEIQFAERVKRHAAYFADHLMIEVNDPKDFGNHIPDVGMEKLFMTSSRLHSSIGTSGVATCLAVCSRAKKADGEVLLAVAHLSCLDYPPDTIKYIFNQFLNLGCRQSSIEFYLLGGILSSRYCSVTEEPFEEIYAMLGNSQAHQQENQNPYNIKALKLFYLNRQDTDEGKSLAVTISANDLRYSKSCSFEGQRDVGIETSQIIFPST